VPFCSCSSPSRRSSGFVGRCNRLGSGGGFSPVAAPILGGFHGGRLVRSDCSGGCRVDHLPRLILVAVALFAVNTAGAVDCPVDGTGYTPATWDNTRTPTGTWAAYHSNDPATICGLSINASTTLSSTGHATMASAETALMASQTASGATLIATCAYTSGTDRGQRYVFQNAAGTARKAASVRVNTTATACTPVDPDFDCSTLANVKTLGSANDQPDSFTPGDTICVKHGNVGGTNTPMNCAAFKSANQTFKRLGPSGARDWLANYQFTGLACDAEPQQTATEPLDTDSPAEKCKSGAGGLTWCEGPEKDADCGYFNDKYVCLKSLGTDKCITKADGSRLCASGAPTPPVPDNGTPGTKAAASDTMQTRDPVSNVTNNYNYYNTTVNSGSSRDTGSGPSADGSGTVGPGGEPTGSGTGEGTGDDPTADDEASGGATCEAAPVCSGDPIQCVLLTQQWKTRCPDALTSSEALSAFNATEDEINGVLPNSSTTDVTSLDSGGPISVGACPAPLGISVMGQSISLDIWKYGCDLALLFAPFVMAMSYFGAAMLLIRSVW